MQIKYLIRLIFLMALFVIFIDIPVLYSENSDEPSINETMVYTEFKKISETPFKINSNNCTTKSYEFAHFLYFMGAKPYIMTIQRKDGKSGHMVVVWHNLVYDPTSKPAFYGQPKELYLDGLREFGFDGAIFTIPYRPGIK